jgi:hypothetical protein
MSVDEQEALSVSLTRGLWCVPLSSGRIAVFHHPTRPLLAIVDTWADVLALEPRPVSVPTVFYALDMELDL